jgi:hypothetical protein
MTPNGPDRDASSVYTPQDNTFDIERFRLEFDVMGHILRLQFGVMGILFRFQSIDIISIVLVDIKAN